jgi:hypothetical protein
MRSRRASALLVTAAVAAAAAAVVGPPAAPAGAAPARPVVAAQVAVAGAPSVVPETVTARLASLATGPAASEGSVAAAATPAGGAGAAAEGTVLSAPVRAPIEFAMVGLELPDGATARVRTSEDGTSWGSWLTAEVLVVGDDGPDAGGREAQRAAEVQRFTEGLWVGASSWLQVELRGARPAEVAASFIDTLGLSAPPPTVGGAAGAAAEVEDTTYTAAAVMPGVVSRAGWGADESLRSGTPDDAGAVRFAVIHHTAGSNAYSQREAPAVVRSVHAYHTTVLGWSDIGYNVLVDRYGTVYEGRAGGMERAIIGAHAQGFNTGSLGVSVLGTFTASPPPQAALDAVAEVVAWTFARNRVSPAGSVLITSGGSSTFPAGTQVPMSTIFGHRDAGRTDCPGDGLYSRLPALRTMVASRMARQPVPAAPVPTPSAGAAPFSDIAGSVHAPSIRRLAATGVTDGCGGGRFCPDRQVTRGQAVSMLSPRQGVGAGAGPALRRRPRRTTPTPVRSLRRCRRAGSPATGTAPSAPRPCSPGRSSPPSSDGRRG